MDERDYGVDALFLFTLTEAGALDFATSLTPVAGDAKVFTDKLISTNVSVELVAFTSGSEEPVLGDTLVGDSSTETCTFMFAVVTSGTWAGTDAAGWLFAKSVSGAFQAEDLDISGGTSDVMSIGADFAAGLFAEVGNGLFAAALTAAELECGQGVLNVIDSAAKAWEDQAIPFSTRAHPAALNPFNGVATYDIPGAGTPQAADASTVTLPATADADDDAYGAVLMVEGGKPTMLMYGSYDGGTKVFTYDPAPGVTFTTGATVYPVPVPRSPTANVPATNPTQLGSSAQSLADLKDFADTGYVPGTHSLSDKSGFALSATGLNAISQGATGVIEIAKAIWDRVLSAGTHNIADSAGRRLREVPTATQNATELLDTEIPEPTGMFAWASATLRKLFGVMGVYQRNELGDDDSSWHARNDADDGDLFGGSLSDDGSDFTSGEAS